MIFLLSKFNQTHNIQDLSVVDVFYLHEGKTGLSPEEVL